MARCSQPLAASRRSWRVNEFSIAPLRQDSLLAALRASIEPIQANAAALDAACAFPAADMERLAQAGLLAAPVPRGLGGFGAGTEPAGSDLVATLLILCGQANPAIGRLFEAHVNALRLVVRFGTQSQARAACEDAAAGHLFGLWVTDPPGECLRVQNGRLLGRKGPCSGAGHCTRALVTADTGPQTGAGTCLFLAELTGRETVAPVSGLHGMRAAVNGVVTLDGVAAPASAQVGAAGDYLREPDFSCGAWRSSAVTVGMLDALAGTVRDHLVRRGQADAPMQQARFGEIVIAQETAHLWVERACARAEAEGGDAAAQVAYVNLARIAVESASLDALRHAQRSLGLAAFLAPHPLERLARDLTTYLRQPAPDSVLLEASAWHLGRPA